MMKKALIYSLSLAMLLSLAACHKPQAEQQEPAPSQAATSESVQDPAATPEPPEQNQVTPEQLSDTIPAAPDEAKDTEPPEETDPEQPEEQIQLFNDVNEVVYATGTVNIRVSWSVNSEKIGSLAVGDSVTRTGIAIEGTEAEGWSRVTLSSGTTAYISNSYLSTTKPAAQQQISKPSGGQQQQQQTQQQTPQGGGTTQTQPSGGGDSEAEIAARKEAFLNGMNQMFEDHGYSTSGTDHDLTEEEIEALVKAVQVGG